MYFTALAVDFDGTIAHDGRVDEDTGHALSNFKESGRNSFSSRGVNLTTSKLLSWIRAVRPHHC